MNNAQRRIVGVAILVVGLVVIVKMSAEMIASSMSPLEEAMELDRTWHVWLTGAAVIAAIEYRLFAD